MFEDTFVITLIGEHGGTDRKTIVFPIEAKSWFPGFYDLWNIYGPDAFFIVYDDMYPDFLDMYFEYESRTGEVEDLWSDFDVRQSDFNEFVYIVLELLVLFKVHTKNSSNIFNQMSEPESVFNLETRIAVFHVIGASSIAENVSRNPYKPLDIDLGTAYEVRPCPQLTSLTILPGDSARLQPVQSLRHIITSLTIY